MIILHGENVVQSRNALMQATARHTAAGRRVKHLEAKNLTLAELLEEAGTESMFDDNRAFVIEELHSLPNSNRKTGLIQWLAPQAKSETFILWEKRSLTATMLKPFGGAQVQEFKLAKSLFKWLESVAPNQAPPMRAASLALFRTTIESDGEVMAATMLAWQLRRLFLAKENNFTGIAPFLTGKLKQQAEQFSLAQLKQLHHQLLLIEDRQKTGKSPLTFLQELELILINL